MGGGSVTVVYIDLLFLLNFTANYLLLLASGRMAGSVLSRPRIAAGAAVGGLYAAAVFLPGFHWLAAWPCKLGASGLMLLAAYGRERRLLRTAVFFLGASAALAGGVLAVELLGGTSLLIEHGVFYSQVDLRLLLLLFLLCYFLLSLFFRKVGAQRSRQLTNLRLKLLGKEVRLTALVDTGHSLTDPVTNRMVIVADGERLKGCLPEAVLSLPPAEAVSACHRLGIPGVRLIPYRAIGVGCGLLLALKAEEVELDGVPQGALLVALSPTPVGEGEGYQALVGCAA